MIDLEELDRLEKEHRGGRGLTSSEVDTLLREVRRLRVLVELMGREGS